MDMGIGINARQPDEGEMTVSQVEIACGVWFTSTGNTVPKMLKYMDDDGNIHVIDNIRVMRQEKKYYCGIPIQEYRCRTVCGNREYLFRLYYYVDTGCWKLSWEGGETYQDERKRLF